MADLFIPLDAREKSPLYVQIYRYIRDEIRRGKLASRTRLPSSRTLCRLLCVSRSTVDLAYGQLVAEGYIEAVPYRGYFVCDIEGMYDLDRPGSDDQEKDRAGEPAYAKDKASGTMVSDGQDKIRFDFTPYGLDLHSFPQRVWQRLSRECMGDDKTQLFCLGEPAGERQLRAALSDYLLRARNVKAHPDQIVVGAGMEYLLMLILMMFGAGRPVAVEDPGYGQAFRLFRNLGHPVKSIPVDQKGIVVERLQKEEADLVYVMPSHQYPLGVVMSASRRMELLAWAREKDGYIIEDDYDSEFRYRGRPVSSLFGFADSDRVIFLGTFSKSVAPAIRVGYMVLPASLVPLYRETCGDLSSTVSKLDQLILARFIAEGYFERHLNRMRKMYKLRHDCLISCLKKAFPLEWISGENAGVHVILTIPGVSEDRVRLEAQKDGIGLYGLGAFYIDAQDKKANGRAAFLIGYANIDEDGIVSGVDRLAKIVDRIKKEKKKEE